MYTDLFLKTHRVPAITEDERAALEQAVVRTTTYNAKQIIVRQQTPLTQCTLLLEGFVERYKDLPDGRRQILAIHIPGDFVDLHSYPLKRLEHSVAALTAIKVAFVPHPADARADREIGDADRIVVAIDPDRCGDQSRMDRLGRRAQRGGPPRASVLRDVSCGSSGSAGPKATLRISASRSPTLPMRPG